MNTFNPGRFRHREQHDDPARGQSTAGVARPSRSVTSHILFQGEREIGIEHAGALYRLKITRQGKLILNK